VTHGYCSGRRGSFSGGDDFGTGKRCSESGEASVRECEKLLEIEIARREDMLRERENSWKTEMTQREDRIRERETRIAWLEGQVRRLETPRLPPCTDDLRIRLKDVATRLPGWCPEEKALLMADQIVQEGTRSRPSSESMPDVRCSRLPWQSRQTKDAWSTPSTPGITPWRRRLDQ
jgi:hypothetical protein